MNRSRFLEVLFRSLLLLVLAGLAVVLGRRISSGSDCSACPGKGICAGKTDCSKFLTPKDGRAEG